jgi:hypothetical protein
VIVSDSKEIPITEESEKLQILTQRYWDTNRTVAYPGILFGVGVQQIQLRTQGRENGVWGRWG